MGSISRTDQMCNLNAMQVILDINYLPKMYIYIFMHLAASLSKSDLQYIQVIHVLSVHVFPAGFVHIFTNKFP